MAKLKTGAKYAASLRDGNATESHLRNTSINTCWYTTTFPQSNVPNVFLANLQNYTVRDLVRQDHGVRRVERAHPQRFILQGVVKDRQRTSFGKQLWRRARQWAYTTIKDAPGHLYMISQGYRLSDGYESSTYTVLQDGGKGVRIYIFDSGIRIDHDQFEGRAENFKGTSFSRYTKTSMSDFTGHGTAVASVAGGKSVGVAPNSTIINVKVQCDEKLEPGCDMDAREMVQALKDVVMEHLEYRGAGWKGSIINMSLDGLTFDNVDLYRPAFQAAKDAGISIVASAGNGYHSAWEIPCAFKGLVTCVGSVDRNYKLAPTSNYGSNVTIFAPGEDMRMARASGKKKDALITAWGTSFAAPVVAGTLALFRSYEGQKGNPEHRMAQNQIVGILRGLPEGSPNKLVNTGIREMGQLRKDELPYIGAPHVPGRPVRPGINPWKNQAS